MSFKIESLYAYIADGDNGDEGIIGKLNQDGTWMPLIAADVKRLHALKPYAQEISEQHPFPVRLVRFTTREDLDIL